MNMRRISQKLAILTIVILAITAATCLATTLKYDYYVCGQYKTPVMSIPPARSLSTLCVSKSGARVSFQVFDSATNTPLTQEKYIDTCGRLVTLASNPSRYYKNVYVVLKSAGGRVQGRWEF